MQEKILSNKKHGMLVLILTIVVGLAATAGTVFGAIMLETIGNPILFIASMVILCIFWIPSLGLRVLKPNEALVLTLFGKYIGTIKGDGFYAIFF